MQEIEKRGKTDGIRFATIEICAFFLRLGRKNEPADGRTIPLLEMRGRTSALFQKRAFIRNQAWHLKGTITSQQKR